MFRLLRRFVVFGVLVALLLRVVEEVLTRRWRANDRDPAPPRHIDGVRRWVTADDGARLAVVEVGTGPVVVLSHGIAGRGDHWAPIAANLSATHRVVSYDQRGHGASERGTDSYTPDRLGRDLVHVLEATDCEDAVIVGHSMGGISVQAGLEHGLADHAHSLVLLSTLPRPVTRRMKISRPAVELFLRIARHPRHGLMLMRGGFGAAPRHQDIEELRLAWTAMSADTLVDALGGLGDFDLTGALASCPLHAEVVCGRADTVTPRSFSRLIAGLMPDAELRLLPGVGHMAIWEAVPEVVDAVGRARTATQPQVMT